MPKQLLGHLYENSPADYSLIKTFPAISAGASNPIICRIDGATSAKRPLSTSTSIFSLHIHKEQGLESEQY